MFLPGKKGQFGYVKHVIKLERTLCPNFVKDINNELIKQNF